MEWAGDFPVGFVRFMGVVDLAGALEILLPSLMHMWPRLTVLAALGCSLLQLLAFGFHFSRSEFEVLPLNVAMLALSLFVLWGRGRKVQSPGAIRT